MAKPKYKVKQNVIYRSQVMRIIDLGEYRTGACAVVEDMDGNCWSTRVSKLSPVPNTVDDMVRHMLELRKADGLVHCDGECSCPIDDLFQCVQNDDLKPIFDCRAAKKAICNDENSQWHGMEVLSPME